MKPVPARMIRAVVADIIQHVPSKRELAQMEHIEAAAIELFADRGPYTLSLNNFARQIGISPHAVGRIYLDREHLLGEILRKHITALMTELSRIAENTPNRPMHCRAAYHRLTRGADGKLTKVHFILGRYLHFLPPDELAPTEIMRADLKAMLGAGQLGEQAAILLDGGFATLDRIEGMLAVFAEFPEPDEAAAVLPQPAANQDQPRRATSPPMPTPYQTPARRSERAAAPIAAGAPPQEIPCLRIVRPPGTILH